MPNTWHFNFAGTGHSLKDEFPSNVQKIHEGLDPDRSFYFEGPGSNENFGLDWALGNLFGIGMYAALDEALEVFKKHYKPGDKVIVIGFSRGAGVGRMFCHRLTSDGIPVDFLGCFDTVFARLPFGRFQQKPLFGDLHVSPLVKVAYHAVSIHEDREAFEPNLMNARDGVEEVWFRGNHADIGGGYEDSRLSDEALRWMIDGMEKAGVVFDNPPSMGSIFTYRYELIDPHREDMPGPREARRFGVQEDDEWTDKWPVRYPNV